VAVLLPHDQTLADVATLRKCVPCLIHQAPSRAWSRPLGTTRSGPGGVPARTVYR